MTTNEKKEMLKRVRRSLRLKKTSIKKVVEDTGLPQKWIYDTRASTRDMPRMFDRVITLHNYFFGESKWTK